MTEWGVILVIITLGGFILSIMKTITPLTKSITSLDCNVKSLNEKIEKIANINDRQDEKLENHEIRITKLENK